MTAATVSLPYRFGGGPTRDEMCQWVVEDGLSDVEIAALVGRRYNTDPPSRQSVAYWRRKYKIVRPRRTRPRLDHSDYRPWRVRLEHTGDALEHRLYDYSRRQKGVPLSAADNRLLDEFLENLHDLDAVLDYDPETENGWLLRPRDPELDQPSDIIRRPVEPADG